MEHSIVSSPDLVFPALQADTRDDVLRAIASLAAERGEVGQYSADDIYRRLLAREEQSSTGFGEGVAIPHCSLDDIDAFLVGAITTEEPVDFGAVDGQPVRLFFFIVGPSDARTLHVRLLASLSRLVRTVEARERFENVQSAQALYDLVRAATRIEGAQTEGPFSMVHVFVQRQELFDDMLEILSSTSDGSVSVLELNSAGHYLNRLPLFSAMWSESANQGVRLIVAVVKRVLVNDCIRRIRLLQEGNDRGVLITVSDLAYAAGFIEL
jgi:PTS system nitrogen regulatory IIA component